MSIQPTTTMVSAIHDFQPFALPYGQLEMPQPGEVELWLLPLQDLAPPLTLSLQQDANPESAAAQRLTRKMMLRLLLAAYLRLPARDVRLGKEPGGKPYVREPADSGLCFSISHSLDYVLVAVTVAGGVGVDLEPVSRLVRNPMGVARRYFADQEIAELSEIASPEAQRRAFLRLWTRKEAVVKATGGGLVSGLGRFCVTETEDQPRLLSMEQEDVSAWTLVHLEPLPGLLGTLAIDRPVSDIRAWRVTPPAAEVTRLHQQQGNE